MRPDDATQIFKGRLDALIHNLRHGKYFGGATLVFIMRVSAEKTFYAYICIMDGILCFKVIEYQHRGLPHAHIAVRLTNHPANEQEKRDFMSRFICARYTQCPPNGDIQLHEKYQTLIKDTMVHRCANAVNGCLNKEGVCKRGYMTRPCSIINSMDEKGSKINAWILRTEIFTSHHLFSGYPVYCRPTQDDLMVVPHNRELLLDWGGHINTELCGNSYAVMYLYKYLFKGNKKVSVDLSAATSDLHPDDEISHYIRGRLLCSMDAVWRIFGYQTYPASFPSCEEIKIKTPEHLMHIEHEQQLCDLSAYLSAFEGLKYTEFCKYWDYSCKLPARFS